MMYADDNFGGLAWGGETSNGRALPLEVKRTSANPTRGNKLVRCRTLNSAAGTRKTGFHRPLLTQTQTRFIFLKA
jgi:hypothetical protein